jgi:hypothetical protein
LQSIYDGQLILDYDLCMVFDPYFVMAIWLWNYVKCLWLQTEHVCLLLYACRMNLDMLVCSWTYVFERVGLFLLNMLWWPLEPIGFFDVCMSLVVFELSDVIFLFL